MADPKLVKLVKQLSKRTQEGKIAWERTVDKGKYQASFPGYSVQISSRRSREDPDLIDYVLTIYDDEGLLIEEVADVSFDIGDFPPDTPFIVMDEMYSMARRKALGVDKALDTLLAEIEGEDDF